jgi:hypothetical protein
MKTPFLIVTIAALVAPAAAFASDAGYRYNKRLGKCVNVQSLSGFNRGHEGECGDLWGVDLNKKDLAKKDLAGANLARADLTGADLSGANLSGANMLLTRLKDANLEGAIYNERTVLPFEKKEAQRRGMVYVSSGEQRRQAAIDETPAPQAGRSNVTIRRN